MNATSKLNVLWRDCHMLAVDYAQVCALKKLNKEVLLKGLLEGKKGHALDRHALAEDCAHVCVLKKLDKVVRGGLLEGKKGHALEARV